MTAPLTIGEPAPPAPATPRAFPCSQSQLRFWVEEQLAPRNPALNVAVRWRLEGSLDQAVLEEAWRRLIVRHDPLRTALGEIDGDPVQRVFARVPFALPIVDLRAYPADERQAEADRLAEREARTPFDVSVAPLIRVTRLILTEQTTILLVTAHHTVCDGWSVGILAREMGQIYAALAAGVVPFLPDLALRYGDFAQWESEQLASGACDDARERVRAMLRDFTQFELLPDHPRPPQLGTNGAIASVLLDRTLTAGLGSLARANGCTLFMTVLAALFALLHRYSGETDIVIGTQVAGRDDEELEKLVGCFINTIALRGDLSENPDFITLMERTRDMLTETFDVRGLPLQQLVEIANPVRDRSRNALFSVNVVYQRSFITNDTYGSFKLVDLPSRSAGALFDLNIFMVERPEGWRISCEYNTDLFVPTTIGGLLDRLGNLLRSVVRDPHERITHIPILSADERAGLIVGANLTRVAYPEQLTVTDLFAAQVTQTPNAPAVICGAVELTYTQLHDAAAALRGLITERLGHAGGARIGIMLERSSDMLVAMLAILQAGCAYVPLDPTYPADRLAYIAADSAIALTLTRPQLAARIDLAPSACLFIGALQPECTAALEPAPVTPAANDIAYIIYTSGSTGKPKGVTIPHRALTNLLFAMRDRLPLSAADTLVAVTTISFDMAMLELLLPLVSGARVAIASESETHDSSALLQLLAQTRATVMQATPVTWQLLVDGGWARGETRLRVLCGGEPLSRVLADELLARGSEVWNLYGPTETTIYSAGGRVGPGTGPVLIGPPLANTQLYVLDAQGELVPPGVAGELYIGGDGVAGGYLNRPSLTAERFVADVFTERQGASLYRTGDIVRRNGESFEFLGRCDQQVKIRGFRIELGEIAAALQRITGVADAIAVAVTDAAGDTTVRAFVVPQSGVVGDLAEWPATLRTALAQELPPYLLPATIVGLERLPRLPNGKIDRRALPATLERPSSGPVQLAQTPTEAVIAGIAADLLQRESVGSDDDLFGLGFHSLLCVRLVARIVQQLAIRIPLRAVFDEPTVAKLARRVDAGLQALAAAQSAQAVVVYNADGDEPPFAFLHSDALSEGLYCRRLAAAIGGRQPVIALAPHGSAGLPVLASIQAMARDHIAQLKALRPVGPYRVGGHCVGGIVAFEVARQLRAQGDVVEQLVIVNSYAPHTRALPGVDLLQRRIGLNSALAAGLREKLCLNIARFTECADRGPAALGRFVSARLRSLLHLRARDANNRRTAREIVEQTSGTAATEAYFAYTVAGFTYHPARYDGPVTLVLSAHEGDSLGDPNRDDPTIGWHKLAPGVRLVEMPGDHNAPVRERVGELGAIVARAFRP